MEAQRPERDQATTRAANGANAVAHETRAQKLARIRREIEAGTYETPDKLQAALERMMGVLVD